MPPTPEQLQIDINQNLQPQATQVAPSIIDPSNTAAVTKEGKVSMPEPQQWIGPIDYGMNWYALGAKAFDVAGNIYERVLDYNIQKKGAEVADAIYDSETQVYDSFNATQLDESGNKVPNDINSVTKFYEDKQTQLRTKINEIIGNDIFDPNFTFDGYGSKWFPVIDGARRGYSELARAGQRVQRDTLITMGKANEDAKQYSDYMSGVLQSQEERNSVNKNFSSPWEKPFAISNQDVITNNVDLKQLSKNEDSSYTYIGGQNGWQALPDNIKDRKIYDHAQMTIPKQGSVLPTSMVQAASLFVNDTTGQANANEIDVFLKQLPQVSESQLMGLQTAGIDITSEKMQKIIAAKAMSDARFDIRTIKKTLSEANPTALKMTDIQMKQATGFVEKNVGAVGYAERQAYNTKFMESTKIVSEEELKWQLNNNSTIRDMYSTGLLISNLTNTTDKQKDDLVKSLTSRFVNNGSLLVSKEQEQDLTTGQYKDKPDGHTIYTFTNIDSLNTSSTIQGTQEKELTDLLKSNPGSLYYAQQEALNSPNKNIKQSNAASLAQGIKGNSEQYAAQITQSVDKTYNLTRRLIPDISTKLKNIHIRQIDKNTGVSYTSGPSEAIMLQFSVASSDQVLQRYNGGKIPVTQEEIDNSFMLALDDIPPADQWIWEPDTSNASLSSRGNTIGNASIGMLLTNIPLNKTKTEQQKLIAFKNYRGGAGESTQTVESIENLLNDPTVFDKDFNRELITNLITGQAMIPFRDYQTNGQPDIVSQQQDRFDYIQKTLNGLPNTDIIVSDTKFSKNKLDTYVLAPKSVEEIMNEVSTSLVRTGRGSSYDSIDNQFLGKSTDIDTKEEFAIRMRKEEPFLIISTQEQLGISKDQATKLYHDLLTSDALYSVYDRHVGDTYFHALADITLSAKQYIKNGMPDKPVRVKKEEPKPIISKVNPNWRDDFRETVMERIGYTKVETQTYLDGSPKEELDMFTTWLNGPMGPQQPEKPIDPQVWRAAAKERIMGSMGYTAVQAETYLDGSPKEKQDMITTWWNGPVGPQRPWRTDVTNATRAFFGYKEGDVAGGIGSKEGVIGGLAKPNASPGAVRGSNVNGDVEEPTVAITRKNFPVKLNEDGSVSTVVSMSFQAEKDGPEILIPTVVGGKQLTEKQAIDRYFKTKEHFGKFSTVEKANAYAKELHLKEEKLVTKNEKLWFDLIKNSEGFEAKAYNKDGIWTIGLGSTTHPNGTPVKEGDVITASKANLYLRNYAYNTVIPTLSNKIPNWYEMNSNQQAALISFAYNMGPYFYGAKKRETITEALKSPLTWNKVPAALALYNKGTIDGKYGIQNGLIKRRKAEGDLWNSVVR